MSFESNNYVIIKNAIDKNFADYLFDYTLLKRNIAKFYLESKFIPHNSTEYGKFGDRQISGSFNMYGEPVFDLLLERDIKPIVEKESKLKLFSTYTFFRIYKKGDILRRHKDRSACKISSTMNIGGDMWPIYLEPSGEINKEGIKVILNPGDMLIYKGCELEHWREAFESNDCSQVFFHFTDDENYKYDGRPFLGVDQYYSK